MRTSSNPPPSATGVPKPAELPALADELQSLYIPTANDKRLKAEFWAKMRETLSLNPEGTQLTLIEASRCVSNSKALVEAWKRPGFKEWFGNGDEARQKLEHLFDIGLDSLEHIFKDTDPKSSGSKVAALKLVAELARKFPKQESEGQKRDFSGMSAAEIQQLLGASGVRVSLTSTTTIEAPEPLDITPKG